VLAVPDAAPRAVLAALDAAPLVLDDASALLRDPAGEAARLTASLTDLPPWRLALARVALIRAVEALA
jgi:hypothetical protein